MTIKVKAMRATAVFFGLGYFFYLSDRVSLSPAAKM